MNEWTDVSQIILNWSDFPSTSEPVLVDATAVVVFVAVMDDLQYLWRPASVLT